MKLYLAGPMSSVESFNFPAFHAAAAALRGMGHAVINPAELDEGVGTDKPWAFYLRRDIPLLLTCEAIVLLPGYETSKGATLELHVAETLEMPAFEYRNGMLAELFTRHCGRSPVLNGWYDRRVETFLWSYRCVACGHQSTPSGNRAVARQSWEISAKGEKMLALLDEL